MTVKWQEPPLRGPGTWEARLLPLMERPGEWALVHETPSAGSARSARQQLVDGRFSVPQGEWEFTARKTNKGGEVYARYLGPKNEPQLATAV